MGVCAVQDEKAAVKQESRQAAPSPPKQEGGEPPEWEAMTIPMPWRPLPLLKVEPVC